MTHVGIRPTDIRLHEADAAETNDAGVSMPATVLNRTYLGTSARYQVDADGLILVAVVPIDSARFEAGERVSAYLPAAKLLPLDGTGEHGAVPVTRAIDMPQS